MPYVDEFEWLEDITSERTLRFVEEMNREFREKFGRLSDALYPRILKAFEVPQPVSVAVSGAGLFAVIRERNDFKVVRFNPDGTTDLVASSRELGKNAVILRVFASRSGRLVAYRYSLGGSDEGFLRVVDTASGEVLGEIRGVIGGAAVMDDGTLYYTQLFREKTPDGVEPPASRVLRWDSGKSEVVFGVGLPSNHFIGIEDYGGEMLVVVHHGWTASKVFSGLSDRPEEWKLVYDCGTRCFPVGAVGGEVFIVTYEGRGFGSVIAVGGGQRRVVVPESVGEPIQSAFMIGGDIYVEYLENCSSALKVFGVDGALKAVVQFPERSSVREVSYNPEHAALIVDTFKGSSLFTVRGFSLTRIASFNVVDFDIDVEDLWVESHDGKKVHAFVVRRRGSDTVKKAMVFGYGGFAIPVTPRPLIEAIPLLEAGGVLVVTNIRGGSEFGEEWHREGMREKKINVYLDFASVLKRLRDEGCKIVAFGRSNGGLLVAYISVVFPELIDGALIGYPVIDLLKFHRFYIGRAWISEYGDPDNPQDRVFLEKYSPYHNIREGVKYPKILVYTGLHDDRVHPSHAFKFVAKLKKVGAEAYLRTETYAGHAGAPPEVRAREVADEAAFAIYVLGIEVKS